MTIKTDFDRVDQLPPYVFALVDKYKQQLVVKGYEMIDFGMGNPDQPTPEHIVSSLVDSAFVADNHRYSSSQGIRPLREAICQWYRSHYQVDLDADEEAIVTIGSKEGLSHLALAITGSGDTVLVPDPTYPIHRYAFVIAGATVKTLALNTADGFIVNLKAFLLENPDLVKVLVINFPSNPTAISVDLAFFETIVALAKQYGFWVVHDLAYADLVFDRQRAPSILQVNGAKEVAIETFTLSKSYNMPGWRVGFACGNAKLVGALRRIKSYLDYGMFAAIQYAAMTALTADQSCVAELKALYLHRRDLLCEGLNQLGWQVTKPEATMFVWAKIPEAYRHLGSLAFTKQLMRKANVVLSPGIGFGEYGDDYVRFSLIIEDDACRTALAAIKLTFDNDFLDD